MQHYKVANKYYVYRPRSRRVHMSPAREGGGRDSLKIWVQQVWPTGQMILKSTFELTSWFLVWSDGVRCDQYRLTVVTSWYLVWSNVIWCDQMLSGVTGCYLVLPAVTRCDNMLPGVTSCYQDWPHVAGCIQGFKKSSKPAKSSLCG